MTYSDVTIADIKDGIRICNESIEYFKAAFPDRIDLIEGFADLADKLQQVIDKKLS